MFMLPMMLGGAALGAIQGKNKANREADIERETRNARSAEQRYSPWTGHAPSTQIKYASGGEFSGMLGGGLQGGMSMGALGQGIDSANAAPADPATPPVAQPAIYGNAGAAPTASGGVWGAIQRQRMFGDV